MPVGHGQRQELRARTRAAAGIRATYTRVEEVRRLPAACKLVDENRPGTSKPRKTRTGSWSLPLPALPLSAQGPYRDISDDLNSHLTIARYSRVVAGRQQRGDGSRAARREERSWTDLTERPPTDGCAAVL
jgi:hypothetical protein